MEGDITFAIDDEKETISLEGSDKDHFIAVVWDDDHVFSGYGDYETVLTYDENYDPTHGIITEVPEGEHKLYGRTGSYVYIDDEDNIATGSQAQAQETVEVVFAADDKVYVKDIISIYGNDTWVEGTIQGNTITIAANQPIDFDEDYDATLSVAWAEYDANSEEYIYYSWTRSNDDDDITFTIDDENGTITLVGSDKNKVVAVLYDDDDWFIGGDYETVWDGNYDPTHGIITEVPDGEVKKYNRHGYSLSSSGVKGEQGGSVKLITTADGTVYIKNFVYASEWDNKTYVKGKRSGNTIIIPANQPVSYSSGLSTTVSVAWATHDTDTKSNSWTRNNDDIVFNVDDENGTITLVGSDENKVVAIFRDNDDYFEGGDYETVWTDDYDPTHGIITEAPDGEHKYYNRSGDAYYYDLYPEKQTGPVEIVFADNNEVYIKDVVYEYKIGAWVKGTINGNTITIAANQPIDFYEDEEEDYEATISVAWGSYYYEDYYYWEEEGYERASGDITFTIDDENGTITLDGSDEEHIVAVFLDGYDYFLGGDYNTVWTYNENYVKPTTELIELPEDAEVETYNASAYFNLSGENDELTEFEVQIAVVGNDIYISGLSEEYPDAWIKGVINEDNTVTFNGAQYIGEYNYPNYGLIPVHVIASDYDLESLLNAFTFTYDPDENTLSLDVDQTILLNLLSDEDIYAITTIDELVIEGIEISYKEEELTKGEVGLSVDNINANEETNDVWYDLSGRRLENKPANRGIYIKNGEKVIVK